VARSPEGQNLYGDTDEIIDAVCAFSQGKDALLDWE